MRFFVYDIFIIKILRTVELISKMFYNQSSATVVQTNGSIIVRTLIGAIRTDGAIYVGIIRGQRHRL